MISIAKRQYCPYCSRQLEIRREGEVLRDYCGNCEKFFYDNPLPVVSVIISKDRNILLVKRKHEPEKGEWCLPSGFAETGESIEDAALRELTEETGIQGKIISLVDVVSGYSKTYGDLIFITFEAEQTGGTLSAGDDASEVRSFSFEEMPKLAFSSNTRAVAVYLASKQDYWAIIDSFSRSAGLREAKGGDYLSDKLLQLIEKDADIIGKRWLADVKTNKSTPTYGISGDQRTYERIQRLIRHFSQWLGGRYSDQEIRENYKNLGKTRKAEGFMLSEVLSALSLIRKHIFEFALSQQVWTKTIDIYMSLELERRMVLFFDKAAFYVAKGYEEG